MGFLNKFLGKKLDVNKQSSLSLIKDMYKNLTTEQKLAILGFEMAIANFANGTIAKQNAYECIELEMNILNISETQFIQYARNGGRRKLEDIVAGLCLIKNQSILDNILYTGYCIANSCKNEQAFGFIFIIFEQLGYTEDDIKNVIQKVNLLGKYLGI